MDQVGGDAQFGVDAARAIEVLATVQGSGLSVPGVLVRFVLGAVGAVALEFGVRILAEHDVPDERFGAKLRIDLAIARGPEEAGGHVHELLDLVAGALPEPDHAQDDFFPKLYGGVDYGVPLPFPNTKARVRAVRFHDLHHVLTVRLRIARQDVEDVLYVAVTVDEDPASDLHDWYGRSFFFYPDEVEPLEAAP